MNKFKYGFLFTIIALSCVSLAFLSGYFLHASLNSNGNNFPILEQAYSILSAHGLYPIPAPPSLEYGMIKGMVQAYDDPYTIFVEPIQHELESENLQGSFGGIGVQITRNQKDESVLSPFPDSPALRAGIQEGDILLAIDGKKITPSMGIDTILALLRGPVGDNIILQVLRLPGRIPEKISIIRETISLPSIIWHLDPDEPRVGIIKVNILSASTPDEILKAVSDLKLRDATNFILDLRDNGGGLVNSGIEVARLFLKDGVIIQEQFLHQNLQTYQVEEPGSLADIPLTVLINHGTASAAEIIAGALKANHRAVLVGMPSFGKNTIQLIYELDDGSSLHLTAAHWWVPDLNPPLAGNGLHPDVQVVDAKSGPDPVISEAVKILLGDH